MSSPARNLGYAWIPQNTEYLEAQPMATTTNVVNLDALIRRADLAAPGEAAEDITSLSVAGLEQKGFLYPALRKPDFQRENCKLESRAGRGPRGYVRPTGPHPRGDPMARRS